MKLSVGLFAASSAVGTDDPAFERPETCDQLSEKVVTCWKPYGQFGTENSTAGFTQLNEGDECGFQYIDSSFSMVNQTCTGFQPIESAELVVGNAVFVPKGSYSGCRWL